MAKQFTLGKNERLKSRKAIEQLFKEGKRFTAGTFKVHYIIDSTTPAKGMHIQFGVGASSKNFKKAVDRNRIKRVTREAYRLQKITLQDKLKANGIVLHLFLVYLAKELPVYQEVYDKVGIILKKLLKQVNENSTANT